VLVYKALLFLHLLAAITWLGGAIHGEALLAMAGRRGPDARARTTLQVLDTSGRLTGPAGVVTIGLGFALVLETAWTFEMPWVVGAVVLAGFAVATWIGFLTPMGRELGVLAEREGLFHPEVATRAARLGGIFHANTALLTLVLFLMVFKPGV